MAWMQFLQNTCRHRFHKVSIKHAQGLFPRWAKAKHAKHASIASNKVSIKHAQGLCPRWAKAKHAKHASIACNKGFHQTCTRLQTCTKPFPTWAKAKHASIASFAERCSGRYLRETCTNVATLAKHRVQVTHSYINMAIYQTCRRRPASLPQSIYQMCTKPLPTLSQSDQTIHR